MQLFQLGQAQEAVRSQVLDGVAVEVQYPQTLQGPERAVAYNFQHVSVQVQDFQALQPLECRRYDHLWNAHVTNLFAFWFIFHL